MRLYFCTVVVHGLVLENGHTHNPLTLWTVLVQYVWVWVNILGDPQCSAEERYNNIHDLIDIPLYVQKDHMCK